ncbi:MAG: hypothetical protein SH850_27510 [Planctomycetaceae bacterium]|nr:hypothetical protein [Planctomycetaceae bacterium]
MTTARPQRSRRRVWFGVITACILLTAAVVGVRNWKSTTSLASIQAAVAKGDLATAGTLVDRYLGEHPTDRDGLALQAKLAEANRDHRKAADSYGRLVELLPGDIDVRHRYGTALLQSAQFALAEAAYRQILKVQSTDERTQTELQWMLFHQLRERELEDFLESCLSREPANSRLLYHLLVSSQKPPNPHESLPVLERIDAACPHQRPILLGMARCAWKLGDVERARTLFDSVRALGDPDREFALALAEYELEQVHLDGVQAALDSARQVTREEWETDDRWWWLQSQLALQRRELDRALTQVSEAGRLSPRSLPYLHARVSLLRLLGRSDEAATLQTEVDARRAADRRLYLVVHSGELDRPSPALMREIADLCHLQHKPQQTEGWRRLAGDSR